MKIEKLTENKIRIVLNIDDLIEKNIDLHSFLANSEASQNFLNDILNKAEQEVGFVTKDCKIMIEALASSDGVFVFTITKFAPFVSEKKRIKTKRRTVDISSNKVIYSFSSFEEFCNLCENMNKVFIDDIKYISKDISLYLYNDTYYLVVNNINTEFPKLKNFYAIISEFATLVNYSNSFEAKLLEHGKVIISKNAIKKGITYFA